MTQRKVFWLASLLLAGLVTLSVVTAQKNDRAETLLQAAQHKQLVEGDLKGALQLYQQIIAQHSNNRAAVAKALVQMGKCYEKQGLAQARKAYDRVVRDYGDQREMVAEARTRLSALSPATGSMAASKAASGLTVRQVRGVGAADAVSPDGRYLARVDRETFNLTLQDLTTGEKRSLTNKTSKDEWYDTPVFSRDGKQITFTKGISKDKKDFYELRIMGIDGSGERVLYRNDDLWWFASCDWSPDGKAILVYLNGTNRSKNDSLALISVADGTPRILKSQSYGISPGHAMYFSPDGRYIAYEYYTRDGASECDIAGISSDGSRDVPLVQSSADDKLLGWAPEGKSILFTSDRAKTIDAWMIPVADGKPQGAPELVKRDIGRIQPVGFTRSGSFYYNAKEEVRDVYIATLAPETGKLIGSPVLAKTRFTGTNGGPDWSPNGRYLAYVSSRGMNVDDPSGEHQIFILNAETGEEREVRSKLRRHNSPVWFPDGKSLLVRDWSGPTGLHGAGLFKIDVETGDATLFAPEKPGSEMGQPRLSHNGKALFYQNKNTLWRRNLETGEVKEVYRPTPPTERIGFTQSIALAPDDERVAFLLGQSLFVVPANGGEARELLKLREPEAFAPDWGNVAWTPDGRYLLFAKRGDKQPELWRIPAAGGEAQKLGELSGRVSGLRVHPDGQRIAFGVRQWNRGGVWVLENFLPTAQTQKASVSRR